MAQRFSGRKRIPANFYPTPAWVTRALMPHLGAGRLYIWEPAAGDGDISLVLGERHSVVSSDIRQIREPLAGVGRIHKCDFLNHDAALAMTEFDAIVTNPPYGLQGREAVAFIERALELVKPKGGKVAMLLKADFDSAKGRRHLFADCPAWAKRIVLLDRILWFEPTPDENGRVSGPSENHAWFLWDWRHSGPATHAYVDSNGEAKKAARPAKRRPLDVFKPNTAADWAVT
jgi:hypothetical protein